MPLPRFIDIDGKRYLWRDLIALRRAQAAPRVTQPTLFELRDDHRPAGERSAAERYQAPSLFTRLERGE
jgi:hypothetical protein